MSSRISLPALLVLSAASLSAQWIADNPVTAVRREADGVVLTLQQGALRLQVCTGSLIRVRYSPTGQFADTPQYVVIKNTWSGVPFDLQQDEKEITLSTAHLKAVINRQDSIIIWKDAAGKQLTSSGPRKMTPANVNGESTYRAQEVFKIYGSGEAFYGLGQHQAGVFNQRGTVVDLTQENTEIAVPFWMSTNGYGVYWNNPSASRFNNRFVHYLYVSSQVADVIDYYFFYGPSFDSIIAAYRELTGAAPMLGKWAYGLWQCKNKYESQQELLDVAAGYRKRRIPVDAIVQDWFWWTTTGEFVFNRKYPDPKGMIDQLHQQNIRIMFSVWPYFYPGSATYADMDRRGYFVDRTKTVSFHPKAMALYDAFNPEARAYYWNLINKSLFQIGADAWWMDTTEPETEGVDENVLTTNKVALGSGARYSNLFPLMTTAGVGQGQRAASDRKRVFILSRSAFAGTQRNGVVAWSGDVLSDWESYKRQIPAALNFSMSGAPYWTSDIGGFFIGRPNDADYRELFVRWFQFGAFCPIFRMHGTRITNQNEIWSYGEEAERIMTRFDKLRYNLMPYIYSTAWKVTKEHYTPMRALVMDFPADERVRNIGDEYLFGPALLVNPVTEPGAATRRVYLPAGATWYDFWTNASLPGGRAIDAPAPLSSIPLYARAGSIVPLGPDIEFAMQKADPIELRVFPGANGDFVLYEDEGDGYDYEKGAYATIPLHWDDATRALSIGARTGSFPGMLASRTFRVTVLGAEAGTVTYNGQALVVRAPR